jgi:uncharacterized alkaline shock family protein YloU
MEGRATVSDDVFARYAADAATGVEGVRALVESHLHRHRGVRVLASAEAAPTIELHLDLVWGAHIPGTGRTVQQRVSEYLAKMTGARPMAVNVVVDAIGPAR